MSTHNNINKICVVVTILALVLTVLFMNGKKLGLQSVVDEDAETYEDSQYFTANDLRDDWDETDATKITLNGDSCKISGQGAYWNDGKVVITGGGYYVISGELNDGSIVVDAYESSKVYIKLNGVDITCSDDACLRIEQADKVFVTLAKDSDNSFESGEEYSDEALEDGTGGVIFAHDDLTINGDGSLTITAAYKHGIDANDDLIIAGGNITINAPKDAIHVNDSIRIANADITIDDKDDGIVTTKEDSYVYIESGTINITSSDDGIHSAGNVLVNGGELIITAGDDGVHSDTNITVADGYINIPQCYEGLEALTIDVTGGEIEIYPTDDGFNANGGSGDTFGMQGGMNDQGMRMGGPGGNFNTGENFDSSNMTASSESTETADGDSEAGSQNSEQNTEQSSEQNTEENTDQNEQSFPNGNMQPPDMNNNDSSSEKTADDSEMVNSDDNSAQNSEQLTEDSSEDSGEEEETYINITGGKITIINETGQDADGLDSNGSIFILGGEIFVSLSGNGTNNAIDYGSENNEICEINGGTIIACGGSGMVEEISTTSAQASIMYNLSMTAEAKTSVKLTSLDGTELLSYEIPCSYSSVVVSTPEIKQGETYKLTMGDTEEEITLDSVAGSYGTAVNTMGGIMGGMQGGRQMNMNDGNMPDMGNFTPPDMSGNTNSDGDSDSSNNLEGFTPPNMKFDSDSDSSSEDFTTQENFQSGQNMNGQNNNDQDADSTESTEDDVTTYSSQKEVTSDEWIWLVGSLGVLLLGILIATAYKKW